MPPSFETPRKRAEEEIDLIKFRRRRLEGRAEQSSFEARRRGSHLRMTARPLCGMMS